MTSERQRGSLSAPMVALGQVIDAGASLLADLIDRIVNGIRGIATVGGLVLGLGCQSGDRTEIHPVAQAADSPQVSELETVDPTPTDGPKAIGKFNITFYYVIGEDEVAPKAIANDNNHRQGSKDDELTAINPPQLVTLYSGTGKCDPIADVSREFASQLGIQGTGKLKDGRVLNIWGACNCDRSPCFKVTENQWGTAGSGRPLQPFRTVAVDPKIIKLGSLLYIPLLEGRTMPGRAPWGGYVHDGCVVADDTGGGMEGNKLDLFVGRKAYFLGLSGSGGSHSWARHVPVFDGSKICERKGRHVARKSGSI